MAALPDLVSVARTLVAERSISSPDARVDGPNRGVIDALATYAEDLGFAVRLQPVHEGKWNLIATYGEGPGGLVLAGHTDTVPFDERQWNSDPFELTQDDDRLTGLGSADMKGFFAAALHAVAQFAPEKLKEPVVLVATADEESTMDGARALLDGALPTARRAIIGEPTGLVPVRMHKGILMEAIELVGRSGHSSDPSLGVNALDAMHHVLGALIAYREQLQAKRNDAFAVPVPTVNLGSVQGGDSPNRICGSCSLSYDVRMLPGMDANGTRAAIQKVVREALDAAGYDDALQVEFRSLASAIPAFETPADAELVGAIREQTGRESEAVMFCTEAPFFTAMKMETVVCGAGSIDVAHQPNEFVPASELRAAAELYASLVHRFCVA